MSPTLTLTAVVELAREVADEVAAPLAKTIDEEGRWPAEAMRALLDARLGGLVVPQDARGLGQGLFALTRVCEELAKACGATAICYGMHSVAAAVIAAKATPDQRERFLEPIARGEHLTTLALSEAGTGVHFYIPEAVHGVRGEDSYTSRGGVLCRRRD